MKPFLIVIKLFHNCYCFLFKPANNNLLSWSNYKIIVFPIFAARGKVDSTFDTIQSDQQKGEQHTTTPPTPTNSIYLLRLHALQHLIDTIKSLSQCHKIAIEISRRVPENPGPVPVLSLTRHQW